MVLGRGERIVPTDHGSYMATWNKRGAPRERRCFPSLSLAQDWLARKRLGGAARPLTEAQYASAQVAVALLPEDISIADAVRAYLATAKGAAASGASAGLRLTSALSRFLSERKGAAGAETLRSYERMVGRLAESNGDPTLSEVSADMVRRFVEGLGPAARNKALRLLSPLFTWAVRRGALLRSPVDAVERARAPEPPLGVLTPDEAATMLHGAEAQAPALVPYLALGLFAGIRPAELRRLTAGCVGAEFVRLDGSVTKTARARTIRIRPNLRAWLDRYPPTFPLLSSRGLHRLSALHASLGVPWPQDCMRHSFATYAYEQSKDAAVVAAEMGHRGTDVFFRHYRALAEPGDGERFFGILPAAGKGG